jgi:hypothetical protein
VCVCVRARVCVCARVCCVCVEGKRAAHKGQQCSGRVRTPAPVTPTLHCVCVCPAPLRVWLSPFRVIGGLVDLYILTGPSPEEVIQQYHALIGRAAMPPYWALGLHQSRCVPRMAVAVCSQPPVSMRTHALPCTAMCSHAITLHHIAFMRSTPAATVTPPPPTHTHTTPPPPPPGTNPTSTSITTHTHTTYTPEPQVGLEGPGQPGAGGGQLQRSGAAAGGGVVRHRVHATVPDHGV